MKVLKKDLLHYLKTAVMIIQSDEQLTSMHEDEVRLLCKVIAEAEGK